MSDLIINNTTDDFLEHQFHIEPISSCSECFLEQVDKEFNADNYSEEDIECEHNFMEGFCNLCGDVAQIEGWTDKPDYNKEGEPNE